jgi:hypothetical protein
MATSIHLTAAFSASPPIQKERLLLSTNLLSTTAPCSLIKQKIWQMLPPTLLFILIDFLFHFKTFKNLDLLS